LARLKELKWTQIELATALKVSPQYINKIVKGRENLTLETIANLEAVLKMQLHSIENYQFKGISAMSNETSMIFYNQNYKPVGTENHIELKNWVISETNKSSNFETAA
jgi:transcriptional regulator with XRE-family HTH domain